MTQDAYLDKKARREALDSLRSKYTDELEKTLQAYVAIRDDAKAPAAARVNAGKRIEAMMGVPRTAEERQPPAPVPTASESPAPKLDEAVEARIRAIIGK